MRKHAFYLITSLIAILEFILFLWALGSGTPLPFVVGLFLGIAVIYLARLYVEEIIEDERVQKIRERTAFSTLQISWIALLAFSLWMIIEGSAGRLNPELRRLGIFGIGLLLVNPGMVILFILLFFYYRKQYGE